MRKVCRLAREVLDIAAVAVKPGVTTDYIDEIVHKACLEREVRFLIGYPCYLLTNAVISLAAELLQLS
jgi:methionine aminopeptidase